jgi:hypothetical protein
MEITFVWSWLSFWIGVASVFVSLFALAVVLAVANAGKAKKKTSELMEMQWGSSFK